MLIALVWRCLPCPISFTQTPLKLFSFFVPNEPTPWHDEWPHVEVAPPFLELKREERVILRSCKRFCPCDRSPITESHYVIAPTIRHHRAAAGWRAIAAKMSNSIECGQPLSSGSFQVIVIASYRSFFFYFHRNYEEGSSRIPASHCAALQRMADRWPLQRNSGIEPLNPETAWEGTTKVEMRLIGFDSGYGFFS